MEFTLKDKYTIKDLLVIVEVLRAPNGCPWDREQTHQSIRKNLIEETYEVAEAIDLDDSSLLCEELGDLLLQIALHTEMEKELGNFTFDDVCNEICQKLVYRHPHVFGAKKVGSTQEVLHNWEQLKNTEKGRITAKDRLDSVPQNLPALMRAEKLQKRADDFGFFYKEATFALKDLQNEVDELNQAMQENSNIENIEGEIGDVLFSATNTARMLGIDAEEALTKSSNRFVSRVKKIEEISQENGDELKTLSVEERDRLWKKAKMILEQKK